jgi:hypothetical protein
MLHAVPDRFTSIGEGLDARCCWPGFSGVCRAGPRSSWRSHLSFASFRSSCPGVCSFCDPQVLSASRGWILSKPGHRRRGSCFSDAREQYNQPIRNTNATLATTSSIAVGAGEPFGELNCTRQTGGTSSQLSLSSWRLGVARNLRSRFRAITEAVVARPVDLTGALPAISDPPPCNERTCNSRKWRVPEYPAATVRTQARSVPCSSCWSVCTTPPRPDRHGCSEQLAVMARLGAGIAVFEPPLRRLGDRVGPTCAKKRQRVAPTRAARLWFGDEPDREVEPC